MEWKWVKSLLIVLFLVLDCFLAYQVYQRNVVSVINPETVQALESILESKNIQCDFELSDIETRKYMRKIKISSDKNIEEEFLSIASFSNKDIQYSGRNREIITLTAIIGDFLREVKPNEITIKNVTLGYYPEINQIDKTILSGEATPAWKISIEGGNEYIYNAYLGDLIVIKENEQNKNTD